MRYLCRQVASQAKQELDGLNVNRVNIQVIHLFIFFNFGWTNLRFIFWFKKVDWLPSSIIQYKSLHSKCLLVENLPPQYRNFTQFRKIFSCVAKPPYCQVRYRRYQIKNILFTYLITIQYNSVTVWQCSSHPNLFILPYSIWPMYLK